MPRQTTLGEIVAPLLESWDIEGVTAETAIPTNLVEALLMGVVDTHLTIDQWQGLLELLNVDCARVTLSSKLPVQQTLPTLGDKLKALRLRKGLTQEGAAKAIGISYASLVQYEANRRTPPYPTILRITRALKVPTDYFSDCDFGDEKDEAESAPPPPPIPTRKNYPPPRELDYDPDEGVPPGGNDPIPF